MPRRLKRRVQGGFSLVEVMVTLFVLAFSLLSGAGLQLASKRANSEALQRTTAAQLAQDIVERMRANGPRAASYRTPDATVAGQPGVDCAASRCDGTQVARFDLWSWARALNGAHARDPQGRSAGGLDSPTGCIEGADGVYTITIAWRGVGPLPAARAGEAAASACGADKAAYVDEDGASVRRVLVLRAFVAG